jgi:hypothetical protein
VPLPCSAPLCLLATALPIHKSFKLFDYYSLEINNNLTNYVAAKIWLFLNLPSIVCSYQFGAPNQEHALHRLTGQSFIDLDQRYPLRELSDVYDSRKARKSSKARNLKNVSWDDVISKLAYDFGKTGIEICLKHNSGDATRRRFSSISTSFDGFTWITINFRAKYINVYMKGGFDGDHELIKNKFSDTIELSRWRDGSNFNVTTQQQFEELIVWLQL